jgi:hypothetical protein
MISLIFVSNAEAYTQGVSTLLFPTLWATCFTRKYWTMLERIARDKYSTNRNCDKSFIRLYQWDKKASSNATGVNAIKLFYSWQKLRGYKLEHLSLTILSCLVQYLLIRQSVERISQLVGSWHTSNILDYAEGCDKGKRSSIFVMSLKSFRTFATERPALLSHWCKGPNGDRRDRIVKLRASMLQHNAI